MNFLAHLISNTYIYIYIQNSLKSQYLISWFRPHYIYIFLKVVFLHVKQWLERSLLFNFKGGSSLVILDNLVSKIQVPMS